MDELTAETDLIGMTADIVSAFVSRSPPMPCRA